MSKTVTRVLTCFFLGLMGMGFIGAIAALVSQDSDAFLGCCAEVWLSGCLTVAVHAVGMEDQ